MALKMSRVAFHMRAVICVVRSERKALMKYLPPVVVENCLPVRTKTSSTTSPATVSERKSLRMSVLYGRDWGRARRIGAGGGNDEFLMTNDEGMSKSE